MGKLLLWAAMVALTYTMFTAMNDEDKAHLDPYIVGIIGISFLLLTLIMLIFTRVWTPRNIGLMSAYAGGTALYLGSLVFYLFPGTSGQYFEPVTDLARTFFVWGGPLLLYGAGWYLAGKDQSKDE